MEICHSFLLNRTMKTDPKTESVKETIAVAKCPFCGRDVSIVCCKPAGAQQKAVVHHRLVMPRGGNWEHALDLLGQCVRNMEHGQPPKGCYTANLIKRVKRFTKRHN